MTTTTSPLTTQKWMQQLIGTQTSSEMRMMEPTMLRFINSTAIQIGENDQA